MIGLRLVGASVAPLVARAVAYVEAGAVDTKVEDSGGAGAVVPKSYGDAKVLPDAKSYPKKAVPILKE